MKNTYKALRKSVVFVAGTAVILAGVVLLVIPGPGLLTIGAGLLILSTEFEWAERHLKNIKQRIRAAYEKSKKKQQDLKDSHKKE